MKKHFGFLAAIFLLGSLLAALGQGFGAYKGLTTVISGGTNNIVGNAAYGTISNYPPYTSWIDVPRSENVVLHFQFKGSQATNAANTVFTFLRCPDRGYYGSNNPVVIQIPANGVTPVFYTTNVSLLGMPYLYMTAPGNSNVQHITNLFIGYGFKN